MGAARISCYRKFANVNATTIAIPFADQLGDDILVTTNTLTSTDSAAIPTGAQLAIVHCDEAMYYDYAPAGAEAEATNAKRILRANTDYAFLVDAGGEFSFLDVA